MAAKFFSLKSWLFASGGKLLDGPAKRIEFNNLDDLGG